MEVVEVVGLLAEADASVAAAELLHQEGVVLLHDLPDQLSRNGSHRAWILLQKITENQRLRFNTRTKNDVIKTVIGVTEIKRNGIGAREVSAMAEDLLLQLQRETE